MRVAHIIKVTRISGAERHLLVLLKGLRDQGVDAHLIILVEPDTPMEDMLAEAQAVEIPIHRLIIHRDYDLTVIFRLRQTLRNIQPEIVHTHLIHADLYGLIAAKLAGIRTVVTSRHNDDHFRYHPVMRQLSRVMWWLCDGGVAISGAIRDFVVEVEGASPDKVQVVRYGLPYCWLTDDDIKTARHSIRNELGLSQDAIILGMVCRLVEQKGIGYALEAFKKLYGSFPNVHLVIAGDGELSHILQSKAKMLGISERTHWLGWRDDAQTIMAALDIFLLPSMWEGFGLVLLEAMGKRVPVIASRVSAIPEIVKHGESGLLVTAGDADELKGAITCLLDDRPLRKYMGLLGDDRLEHEFGVEKMVKGTIALYHQHHTKLLDL